MVSGHKNIKVAYPAQVKFHFTGSTIFPIIYREIIRYSTLASNYPISMWRRKNLFFKEEFA